jgi:division protein CdvB (Snf7/Vps24/ESCRT-III family)
LGNRFTDRWKKKEEQPTIIDKIKNVAKPPENLKQQIVEVTQRLDTQTRMLDNAVIRFQNRDAEIFNRTVKAIANREEARANILAGELAEVRKVEKMLTHASLALQSVSMRLNTVSEMGELVAIMSPAKSVLSSIGSEMCSVLPEAGQELGNIGNILSEICTTSQTQDVPVNSMRIDPEAEAILREAELAAESKLKQQLPEVNAQMEKRIAQRTSMEA